MPKGVPYFEPRPFNSPLEAAVRSLTLLAEGFPSAFDIQRLLYLDYLLIHSGDVNGPESLHPPIPERTGELFVRRELVEKGLHLLLNRGLIERIYNEFGIVYKATEEASPLLDCISALYLKSLRERAIWVINKFNSLSDTQLETFFHENLGKWGGEFETELILKEAEVW